METRSKTPREDPLVASKYATYYVRGLQSTHGQNLKRLIASIWTPRYTIKLFRLCKIGNSNFINPFVI